MEKKESKSGMFTARVDAKKLAALRRHNIDTANPAREMIDKLYNDLNKKLKEKK